VGIVLNYNNSTITNQISFNNLKETLKNAKKKLTDGVERSETTLAKP